jgi:hypothetical protein
MGDAKLFRTKSVLNRKNEECSFGRSSIECRATDDGEESTLGDFNLSSKVY